MSHPMQLTILGATGSIGTSTFDVMLRHPEQFQAYALVGHKNVTLMQEQIGRASYRERV